jgi:hypothetical protein
MTIEITHKRALTGNDITVKATDEKKGVSTVETKLDGFMIGRDTMDSGSLSYERTFTCQGSFTPGDEHTVEVTASNGAGRFSRATHKWTDE